MYDGSSGLNVLVGQVPPPSWTHVRSTLCVYVGRIFFPLVSACAQEWFIYYGKTEYIILI